MMFVLTAVQTDDFAQEINRFVYGEEAFRGP